MSHVTQRWTSRGKYVEGKSDDQLASLLLYRKHKERKV